MKSCWLEKCIYIHRFNGKNERDPNKNNKGKIMEGKILMRGKNTQYISEEIDVSCLDVKVSKIIEVGQKDYYIAIPCKNYKVSNYTE